MLASFPVAVIKHSDKGTLRGKGFGLDHTVQGAGKLAIRKHGSKRLRELVTWHPQ